MREGMRRAICAVYVELWEDRQYYRKDNGIDSRRGLGNFFLHHRVQNGSGAHPTSYPMGTRGSFTGGKAAGAWSWPLTFI
jgi:hypothetical protein